MIKNISSTVRKHYFIEESNRQVTACLKNGGLILKLKLNLKSLTKLDDVKTKLIKLIEKTVSFSQKLCKPKSLFEK